MEEVVLKVFLYVQLSQVIVLELLVVTVIVIWMEQHVNLFNARVLVQITLLMKNVLNIRLDVLQMD